MKHRILVLGAGYAGASAAGRLARRLDPTDTEITLINAEPHFVERVRLHQVATGQTVHHRPLAEMLDGTGVTIRIGCVVGIDVAAKGVTLADGETLVYDTLVHGLGSGAAAHGVPGSAENAHQLSTHAGALRLRDRLAELPAGQTVAVVGGGLTGIEAVTEIAESRPDLDVTLVTRGRTGDWLSRRGRHHLDASLTRLGITVRQDTAVERVDSDALRTDRGRVPAAVTVWTAGFAANVLTARSDLDLAPTGQIIVDETMRSVSHPDVYAVGDTAWARGHRDTILRMSCATGIPVSWQAADAIAARLSGRRIPTIPLRYAHQCISLGREDGIIQVVTGDDRSVDVIAKGGAAARYKEFICRGAAWAVGNPTFKVPTRRRGVVHHEPRAGVPRVMPTPKGSSARQD